jgi:hypothetical protein
MTFVGIVRSFLKQKDGEKPGASRGLTCRDTYVTVNEVDADCRHPDSDPFIAGH